MRKFLNKRQDNEHLITHESKIVEIARGNNERAFTRNRKMPVCDILTHILTSKRQTVSMELRNYFAKKTSESHIKTGIF